MKKARKSAIVAVLLALVSIFTVLTAGASAVWPTSAIRVVGLVLLPTAMLLEPAGGVRLTTHSVAALAFLGVFGGPVATWAANSVSRALPALVTSIGFLGVPLVSLVISVALLGEKVTRELAVGGGLILSALLILAVRRPAGPPKP